MLLQAAAEHGLLLAQSWMIGDRPRDALAGRRAGCRGSLLVRTGRTPLPADALDHADGLFADLSSAAQFVLDRSSRDDMNAGDRAPDPN